MQADWVSTWLCGSVPAPGPSWCFVYPACLQELEVWWQWGSGPRICAVVVLGASMTPLKKSVSWHLHV